jgi:hypothetical protein
MQFGCEHDGSLLVAWEMANRNYPEQMEIVTLRLIGNRDGTASKHQFRTAPPAESHVHLEIFFGKMPMISIY